MAYLSEKFAFFAGSFFEAFASIDTPLQPLASLPPRALRPLFYSAKKGGERILFLSLRPVEAPNQWIFVFAFEESCSDNIFCNPNAFYPSNPFVPLVVAVLCPARDIM